jgi:hypothetical protein
VPLTLLLPPSPIDNEEAAWTAFGAGIGSAVCGPRCMRAASMPTSPFVAEAMNAAWPAIDAGDENAVNSGCTLRTASMPADSANLFAGDVWPACGEDDSSWDAADAALESPGTAPWAATNGTFDLLAQGPAETSNDATLEYVDYKEVRAV